MPPPDNAPESPLNLTGGVDDALVRLLNTVSARASSVNAVRDACRLLSPESETEEQEAVYYLV